MPNNINQESIIEYPPPVIGSLPTFNRQPEDDALISDKLFHRKSRLNMSQIHLNADT